MEELGLLGLKLPLITDINTLPDHIQVTTTRRNILQDSNTDSMYVTNDVTTSGVEDGYDNSKSTTTSMRGMLSIIF